MATIPDWTDVSNSFELETTSPHSTLDASASYAVGGPFSQSEIKQEITLSAGYEYGDAVLTYQRANMLADDRGAVVLEALNASDDVLKTALTSRWEDTSATYYLRKIEPTAAWNTGGCSSEETLDGDGWVEFTIDDVGTTKAIGLSTSDTDADEDTIGWAFYIDTNQASVHELGV
jgi:hypothetical protein